MRSRDAVGSFAQLFRPVPVNNAATVFLQNGLIIYYIDKLFHQ
jgi:hypothetical protein